MRIALPGADALELKNDIEDWWVFIDPALNPDMARQHPVEVQGTLVVAVVNPARKLPAKSSKKLARDMKSKPPRRRTRPAGGFGKARNGISRGHAGDRGFTPHFGQSVKPLVSANLSSGSGGRACRLRREAIARAAPISRMPPPSH